VKEGERDEAQGHTPTTHTNTTPPPLKASQRTNPPPAEPTRGTDETRIKEQGPRSDGRFVFIAHCVQIAEPRTIPNVKHEVTIWQHKGHWDDKYDPYIIAEGSFLVGCECGWYSDELHSYDDAIAAAREHGGQVPDKVVGLHGEPPPENNT
jgi:hypothetical protein